MNSTKVDFLKGLVYWCSECDAVKVNSDDSSTGSFHMKSGHVVELPLPKEGSTPIGEWVHITWAVCTMCENK